MKIPAPPGPVKTVQEGNALKASWNNVTNDKKRWAWVVTHKEKVKVMVDNDSLHLQFRISPDCSHETDEALMEVCAEMQGFTEFGYNAIPDMLSVFGIESEFV